MSNLSHISTSEIFLIALTLIFSLPFLIWRYCKLDFYAPLVVVQIILGIILGPGLLGAAYPAYYELIFQPTIIQSLNGIAWWAVMLFVFIAGIELDLSKAWQDRKASSITAGMALGVPLIFGSLAGLLLCYHSGWIGSKAQTWQFVLGIGMSCAVTALPILVLLMDKLAILREPIGQRILRYASLDDIAIWAVLALILLDWQRLGRQLIFLLGFSIAAYSMRSLLQKTSSDARLGFCLIWLAAIGFFADWAGLHFMVGAFLAGAIVESKWFEQRQLDTLRDHVLLIIMPVFFLSTGLRTSFTVGSGLVFVAAFILLFAAVTGKLIGIRIAGKLLNWPKEETRVIGWLLQTKALIMIIFANVLLDKSIISGDTFTALLIMAVCSTMLTVPMVSGALRRLGWVSTKPTPN